MAIRSVKTAQIRRSLLAGNSFYDPGAYYFIERITPSNGTTAVAFNNIPQIYKHLQIRILNRDTDTTGAAGTSTRLQFNSDTSANYANHRLQGNGSAAAASGTTGDTAAIIYYSGIRAGAAANIFGAGIVDIHDYTNTSKNKTVRYFAGGDANTSSTNYVVNIGSSLWLSTAAISSITVNCGFTAFASKTTFALYGIVG